VAQRSIDNLKSILNRKNSGMVGGRRAVTSRVRPAVADRRAPDASSGDDQRLTGHPRAIVNKK